MEIYQETIKKYDAKILKLKKVLNSASLLRLFVFVLSSIILIALFSFNRLTPALVVFPISIVCFALAIKRHGKIAFLKKHTVFLKEINEAEILRGMCKLEEFDTGQRFIDPEHPYTSDLDIFGQHSIFQLVNRTTTESGMILLSKWLSEPASKTEILDRQNAIKELSPQLDWRQNFQAAGMHFQNKKSDYEKLVAWVEAPIVLLKNQIIYKAIAIILSILSFIGLFLFIANWNSNTGYLSLIFLVIMLLINNAILRKVSPLSEDIVENAQKNLSTFKGYETLINKIEGKDFSSTKLHQLKSLLLKNKYSALKEIKRLCRLLEFSEQRGVKKKSIGGNQFYPVLNSFLLLDIYIIIATEKWKSRNKMFLASWSGAVSGFEVVNSFAGFYYSNPSFTFPEIVEKKNYVHFEALGHPLINSNKRVCNNFISEEKGVVAMITGSNMGGKSTFLRTVGVNIVLSLAGAPCSAKYGQVSNLTIYTSMRTQDNLKEGISSFYAELNRIEKMLQLIESKENVFFYWMRCLKAPIQKIGIKEVFH